VPWACPSFEQRFDDIRAVMDAVGSTRAAVLGCSEGAPISVLFAATYPERTSRLILFGGFARFTAASDYPFMRTEEELLTRIEALAAAWGTGTLAIKGFLPSRADDPDAVREFGKLERLNASPGALRAMFRYNMLIDVRPILPSVRVPTLVLHRRTDAIIRAENGRYLAGHIPGARYVEYDDCSDHLIFAGDTAALGGDIEEFVTGNRGTAASEDVDRVLATVLFTDIIDSTRRAAEMRDQAWHRLLDEHDRAARRTVAQHRGTLVRTTGDGILATFDGPGRAIRCALAFGVAAARLGLPVRAGLRTGEIELRGEDGVPWRMLPPRFPPRQTVYGWFAAFRDSGVWEAVTHQLVMLDRERAGREASPSAAVIDSQSDCYCFATIVRQREPDSEAPERWRD
jgi:transposase